MSLQTITEAVTNPQIAVPVATAGTVANLLVALPHIISVGWIVYLVLLIGHKGWQMYKEWRDDRAAQGARRSE